MLWDRGAKRVYYYFRLCYLFCCSSTKVHFEGGPRKTVYSGFLWFLLARLYLFAEMFRLNTSLNAVLSNQPMSDVRKCASFLQQVAMVWDIPQDGFSWSRKTQIWEFQKHVSYFIDRFLCQNNLEGKLCLEFWWQQQLLQESVVKTSSLLGL